jgi:hypothetical protein
LSEHFFKLPKGRVSASSDTEIPEAIAPNVNSLGFMLPYTPVSHFTFGKSRKTACHDETRNTHPLMNGIKRRRVRGLLQF